MSRLLIDRGNSATKWRIVCGGDVKEGRDFDSSMPLLAAEIAGLDRALEVVYVASVLGVEANDTLARMLAGLVGPQADLKFVEVSDGYLGLRLAYQEPKTLGVDRWLIMLAAKERFELPLVVLSAGTALTFDAVSKQGEHLGGLIAPGWKTLSQSLAGSTAKLGKEISLLNIDDCTLGENTQSCLNSALSIMFLNYIKSIDRQFAAGCKSKILCGGDAGIIAAALSLDYKTQESLVLDGLELLSR